MKKLLLVLLLLAGHAQAVPVSLFFDSISVTDLARVVYGEIARTAYIFTPAALKIEGQVSLQMRNLESKHVVEQVGHVLETAGYSIVRSRDLVVIDVKKPAEKEEDEIIVYRPQHRSSRYLTDVVQSVTGAKSLMSRTVKQEPVTQVPAQQNVSRQGQQAQPVGSGQRQNESPTSAQGQIDRSEVDQLALSVVRSQTNKIRKLLQEIDTPASEIVLKAAVYEVGTDRKEGSAITLAASLIGGHIGINAASNPIDGVSFRLSFGGIEAALAALDADSRFRSVSRPRLRVRNGAQARFAVGSDVPVLGGSQLDRNGNVIQSIDYRQSGVILSVTPEIREQVIELNLNQEISNFVQTSTGVNNSPTLNKRSVSTRLSIQPGEVVVLAGLVDDGHEEKQTHVPFFGWQLGQDVKKRQSEILVLIEAQKI